MPTAALGIAFDGRSSTLLEDLAPLVDVVEVMPEGLVDRYSDPVGSQTFAALDRHASHLDLSYHGIGLSIGTATGCNEHYLDLLERLCAYRCPARHSEHLGFTLVDDHFLGTVAAVPATSEVADLVAARSAEIRARFGVEFLLEQVASPFARPDEMTPAALLNEVARGSGCGIVLDLHNLECDEDNGQLCVDDFLEELDAALVREIHVGGGVWRDGYHLDVHAQLPSPATLARLESTLPTFPNADLVVFEIDGAAADSIGRDDLVATMRDLRLRMEGARVAG